jgi:hypothetical protein
MGSYVLISAIKPRHIESHLNRLQHLAALCVHEPGHSDPEYWLMQAQTGHPCRPAIEEKSPHTVYSLLFAALRTLTSLHSLLLETGDAPMEMRRYSTSNVAMMTGSSRHASRTLSARDTPCWSGARFMKGIIQGVECCSRMYRAFGLSKR